MFKSFRRFQKEYCGFCRENRAVPYCEKKVRCEDCPWKKEDPPVRWPGDETMKTCACCGKNIYIPEEMHGYIYKSQHYSAPKTVMTEYYCGWNCMRKEERNSDRLYDELGLQRPRLREWE